MAITGYKVSCAGSPDGVGDCRVNITLFSGLGIVGYIRFHDPGMPFPNDSQDVVRGWTYMNMPSSMLGPVVDLLRNEKPIEFKFVNGHTFLDTGSEPVGEGEPVAVPAGVG